LTRITGKNKTNKDAAAQRTSTWLKANVGDNVGKVCEEYNTILQ
jgi:hypothetical protein